MCVYIHNIFMYIGRYLFSFKYILIYTYRYIDIYFYSIYIHILYICVCFSINNPIHIYSSYIETDIDMDINIDLF